MDPHQLLFTLKHYAGEVTYTAQNWLDKDRLGLLQDLTALMIKSESPLIASLFYTPSSEEPTKEAPQGTPTRRPKKEAATKKERTVFASFRASLRSLSATLETTSARYIRCALP